MVRSGDQTFTLIVPQLSFDQRKMLDRQHVMRCYTFPTHIPFHVLDCTFPAMGARVMDFETVLQRNQVDSYIVDLPSLFSREDLLYLIILCII